MRGPYPDGLGAGCPYRVWTLAPRPRSMPGWKIDMTAVTSLTKLRAPLGGQEIELQQIDFVEGGMSLLRTRIREKSRFTIFDIDPQTAEAWGQALLDWARRQPRA